MLSENFIALQKISSRFYEKTDYSARTIWK